MILILHPDTELASAEYRALTSILNGLKNISTSVHDIQGAGQRLTEIYLLGDTISLDVDEMGALPCVERVVRISREYRAIGRHSEEHGALEFDYNGVRFSQENLNLVAGLCAVSSPEHVEQMMRALKDNNLQCTRMGAYKPRTSPYSFQGLGKSCLHYVFELAGKYDIRVIAMEVTHESQVEEIDDALRETGNPTGVMLQLGTRNIQNFELLKLLGRQHTYPVLVKRGFGITLEESLNAAEYLASEGNRMLIFALRGMKTNMGDPHRNFVDFAHVPVLKRLTRMPICIDPSHSVGSRDRAADGLLDVFHVTAQGVIAGANMILVDFHPEPSKALVDGPQALLLDELSLYVEDIRIAREAYQKRRELGQAHLSGNAD